ncbi:MAG: hypothetical protein U1F56_10305 [Rubrivivax sp.]
MRRRPRRPPLHAGRLWMLAAAGLLAAGPAGAAAFLPGSGEADPPTGDGGPARETADESAPRGGGIRLALGPIKYRGAVGLDLRHLSGDGGRRSDQTLLRSELEIESYVWQPWFLTFSSAVGALLSRDSTRADDVPDARTRSFGLYGSVQGSLFPMSRFPTGLSVALSDTRATGDTLAADYRVLRVGFNQSYRPPVGNDSYSVNVDYSRASTVGSRAAEGDVRDWLLAVTGNSQHRWTEHSVESNLAWSTNARSTSDDRSRTAALSLRHSYYPESAFSADNLASWSRTRFDIGGARLSLGDEIRQVSSVMNWRAREGDWLYSEQRPVTLGGSVRVAEVVNQNDQFQVRRQLANASAGISAALSESWRGSANVGLGQQTASGETARFSSLGGVLSYAPAGESFGDWRYTPSASVSAGLSDSSTDTFRRVVGVQGSHNLTRLWALTPTDAVSVAGSQSVGLVQEWPTQQRTSALAHTLSAYWQSNGSDGGQTFVSLSASDSHTRATGPSTGRFRLYNLQLSRRDQLSRFNSWSASFTAQASRSTAEQTDPFSGAHLSEDDGWQRFYSGTLTYESQRLWGVPRLRFSALLSANSQLLERRQLGDVNAPLEQTTQSAEARLDWAIGRLDTRLAARYARVDGKKIAALTARIQRRF